MFPNNFFFFFVLLPRFLGPYSVFFFSFHGPEFFFRRVVAAFLFFPPGPKEKVLSLFTPMFFFPPTMGPVYSFFCPPPPISGPTRWQKQGPSSFFCFAVMLIAYSIGLPLLYWSRLRVSVGERRSPFPFISRFSAYQGFLPFHSLGEKNITAPFFSPPLAGALSKKLVLIPPPSKARFGADFIGVEFYETARDNLSPSGFLFASLFCVFSRIDSRGSFFFFPRFPLRQDSDLFFRLPPWIMTPFFFLPLSPRRLPLPLHQSAQTLFFFFFFFPSTPKGATEADQTGFFSFVAPRLFLF